MLTRLSYIVKRLPVITLLTLLCFCYSQADAQYFDLQGSKKHVTIPFRMIRDMIIIQLKINQKGPYNFILDTGAGLMFITDPKLVDSINIANKRTIKIAGLGEGEDFEAYVTPVLDIDIPGLVSYDVAAAILKTDRFGLSNYAGIPIRGLLGYEFFSNLAVKINFADSTLSVSRPKDIKIFRKGTKIPITIEDRKPYLQGKVTLPDDNKLNTKLVLDIGAGHSLSLEKVIEKYGVPKKFIAANLGVGLAGPVSGLLSRVKEFEIGRFKMKDMITSFPVGNTYSSLQVKRDGNMGIGVLKRFNVIIDYPDSALYLKPGSNYKTPYEHDMSGLEYYGGGEGFNHIIVSRVEPGSAADEVGIEKDDEILAINFKPVNTMTLEEVDNIFKSQNDRSLYLEVFHDNKHDNVIITLRRRI